MTWLTWRQFRSSAAVAVGLLALVAVLLALAGHRSGAASCVSPTDCDVSRRSLIGISRVHLLQYLSTVLVAVPVLTGMFWGAPLLARELETGTHRLAWTQGVTRARWLVVKIGLVGVASIAVSGALSLMLTLWSSHAVNLGRFAQPMFDERGIAPLGDTAFAFALGLMAGVLIRRTVPAMAATLAAFIAVRLIVTDWIRPHFATPLTLASTPGVPPPQPPPGSWVVANQTLNPAGKVVSDNFHCTVGSGSRAASGGAAPHALRTASAVNQQCMAQAHAYLATLRQVVRYQPLSRYWMFQAYDVAVYLGLAMLLCLGALWWVRHRLT
jgi:voltage-gated potassium channel Kch